MKRTIEIAKQIWRSQPCVGYFTFVGLTLLGTFSVRLVATFLVASSNAVPDYFFAAQLVGWYVDFSFVSFYVLILGLVYVILFKVNKALADGLMLLILTGYLLLETLLEWYFSISLTPLTYQGLAGVSSDQAAEVAAIYGFKSSQLFWLIPMAIFVFGILWKARKIFAKSTIRKTVGVIFFCVGIGSFFIKIQGADFESELNFQGATNKLNYFTNSFFVFEEEQWQLANADADEELALFYELNGIKNKTDYEYPFYSDQPLRNSLAPFFPVRDSAPNVVFVICESLGKQFSGDGARLGSFTPFLDSLAGHALYWSNFMANAERTFGALPNLLAGLPEGESGFMNLKHAMPDHLSLPQLLKENNGYQTAFFCGALKEFDHMDQFLMTQKFDHIKGKHDFKPNKRKTEIEDAKGNKKYFNWGAEDEVVFNQSFIWIDSLFLPNKPYFNVYLTTSFHEPFNYSRKEDFNEQAKKRIAELNPPNVTEYIKELETFAALMYMDDALRGFFEVYQKRPEFENTIFVICGDHSIKFMGNDTRLEKFHVPLLIYSPMLKEPRRIKSMACHKDVPAAIQGLLKENFGLNLPGFSISQTDNLQTGKSFSADGSNHVLMYADKQMKTYVWKNYLYMDEMLFKIGDDLKLEKLNNPEILEALSLRLTNYKRINNYVCNENRLIPNDIFQQFSKEVLVFKSSVDFEQKMIGLGNVFSEEQISDEHAFSGKRSLTNLGQEYVNLLKDYHVHFAGRLRLKVSFVIQSKTGSMPSLIIYRNGVKDGIDEKLDLKTILLDQSYQGILKKTKRSNWFLVETGYWFDEQLKFSGIQKIGVFLFVKNGETYFIDDLKMELRQF